MSAALDDYAKRNPESDNDPESDNVAVRWLSRKEGFEVTLKFGAPPLVSAAKAPE